MTEDKMTPAPGKPGRKPRAARATFRDASGKRLRFHLDPNTGEYVRYAHQLTKIDHKGNLVPRKIKDPTLLIIDTATNSYTESGLILEVAALLIDCRPPYDIIEHYTAVVRHDPGTLEGAPDFHSALVAECYAADIRLPGREGMLLGGPFTSAFAVLDHDCGFTLRFLAKHCPTFYKALPKCRVDLAGVQLLMTSRGVPKYVAPAEGRDYRAMSDCVLAWDELTHYLSAEPIPASRVVP